MRPRRPVDAVIVVEDGTAERPDATHQTRIPRIAERLRWSAPVFLLNVSAADRPSAAGLPIVACDLPRNAEAAAIEGVLCDLRDRLARKGTERLTADRHDSHMAELSERLDDRIGPLADWAARLPGHQRRATLAGIVYTAAGGNTEDASAAAESSAALWSHLATSARRHPGRRIGLHPVTVFSTVATIAIAICTAGMLVSGFHNARNILDAQQALDTLDFARKPAERLRGLLAVQQQIERYTAGDGGHYMARFGLNRDAAILAALWKPYASASAELLVAPIQQDLEDVLVDLAQVQVAGLNEQASQWALGGHQTLKTYLMLARPERAEPDFLAAQLVQHWQTDARITPGERDDLARRLLTFYAGHVRANPGWRIAARPEIVAGARQTVLAVIGQRNAQDTIYRQVIDEIGDRFPDQTLASLAPGIDTRGLVRANTLVPGAYTRQAYEGHVADAIEQAARRAQITADWVLSDTEAPRPAAPSDLQAALAARYFADYADHWQRFMNSLQWEPAPTLPAAIDQLKGMADARQSPVIALMKSLEYHGGAGARRESLSDSIVAKAQDMLGKKAPGVAVPKPDNAGPLGPSFGPVFRLVAQDQATAGDMSLQRFLDRATALRLRLQQVSNSPDADAQARQLALALFQGKGSELADTQAYAQLIAASLGAEWAGMGDALFVRPITQATQTILRPAQASLNDAWRESIAMAWGRSFAGRYPFADTANDASLPELARFLRPEVGLIHGFLAGQLAGVLALQGDQWQPAATGGQALAFDPAFLAAINRLQRIGVHLLAQGEPRYRFEIRPIPTPGLTDTLLTLDGQKLRYYNQRETWHAMTWPADSLEYPGTRLQWQTETAGTNKHYEFTGRWGLVRMLERAAVEPLDSATFRLTWQGTPDTAPAPATPDADSLTGRPAMEPAPVEVTYPIRYLMRTELGHGPLELLSLRNFVLPSRIFLDTPRHKGNDV